MIGLRMSSFWILIFLVSFAFNNLSEASDPKKLPSAVVVGTVYCDTCFHQDFSKASHFISGALIAVECSERSSRTSFREVVKTNERGEFKVQLPFSVSKHVKRIEGCSVKLLSSSEPFCAVASTATSSSLRLKSRKEGTRIFSAGFFTFKPLKQPELCNQKSSIPNPKKLNAVESSTVDPNVPTFLPTIQNPPTLDLPPVGQNYLPPLPQLPPLPNLPPLPPLPGVPYIPPVPTEPASKEKKKTTQTSNVKVLGRRLFDQVPFFPPNPLLPPPSILPPNPLLPPPSIVPPVIPSPPPSIFPPIFPSPPPSIFPPIFPSPPSPPPSIFPPIFPSPPSPPPSVFPPVFPLPGSPPFKFPPLIPGLTSPPPPSPPPPSFPFIPPFPFQPTPGFPGVPPAVPSSSSSKKSLP